MAEDALECELRYGTEIVDEDEILVSAAQEDTEAAGRLYDKYYGEIVRYIYHCTFDHIVTEDLTSNVFLAALRHIGRYSGDRFPSGPGSIVSPPMKYGCTGAGKNASRPSVFSRTAAVKQSRTASLKVEIRQPATAWRRLKNTGWFTRRCWSCE